MTSNDVISQLAGATAVGADGEKLGTIGQVYLDDATGEPQWVTVKTGLFGTSQSFIPLGRSTVEHGTVRVPYDKDTVKGAPRVDDDGHLEPHEEDELYRYYGLGDGHAAPDGRHREGDSEHTTGHDTSGPTTDSAMTRSEEQLNVHTARREAGRVRLRKHVVTEEQTATVPVSHDEVRVKREPITDANIDAAMDGPAISEEEHEVVLEEEVPVVTKEARPVERVSLDTQTVTEQQQVTEDVRKERIETDGDPRTGGERI
jgi:uncharacterized protein (TIGR02271 family)